MMFGELLSHDQKPVAALFADQDHSNDLLV